MKPLAHIALISLAFLACSNGARDDYDHFRARSEGRRNQDAGALAESSVQDLNGRWLLHALMAGIHLGLIVDLEAQSPVEGEVPTAYTARIWYWKQDVPVVACSTDAPCLDNKTCNRFGTCESPPLVTTEVTVDETGGFDIVANPLSLPAELLRLADPILADVTLRSVTASADNWCGNALGSVTSPITLDLKGTTFSSFRHVPQDWVCKVGGAAGTPCATDAERADLKNYEYVAFDLPLRCEAKPGDPVPDAGVVDAGTDGGPVGPQRPESPDLSAFMSVPRDITGNWIFQARVNGAIPLQLWLTLFYTPAPDGTASLDGALRSVMAEPGTPALATFTTVVDAEGRFEVWLPGLSIATDLATVQADILLAGVTLADALCGRAAGAVNQPPLGALNAATTFYAVPWDPNTDAPEGLPAACPAPE